MKTNHTFSLLTWVNRAKMNNGLAPIYIRITVNGKRAELSTKRSIQPEKWNTNNGTAKGSTEESRALNSYINLVKGDIERHYSQMLSSGEHITAETIKNRYTGRFEKKNTLLDAFESHNKMAEAKIGLYIVETTWKKYGYTKDHVAKFMKSKFRRSDFALDELNHRFVVDFDHYLRTEARIRHNTSMQHIIRLKTVIGHAVSNEWLQRDPFANFKCPINEVGMGFLSKDELDRLMGLRLPDPLLERARDVFVFQCHTGYGYSEVARLTAENINIGMDGYPWCSIQRKKTQNKTAKKSNVPLLPQAVAIIEKYKGDLGCKVKGTLLPVDSNQDINKRLKIVAKLCGLNKRLTTHMGRHTFATTVTLTNGVPLETVSSMLGHSRITTTQIYAKVVETKVSEDMARLRERMMQSNTQKESMMKVNES